MSPIEMPSDIQLVEKRETRTSRGMLSKGWYRVDGQLVMVKGNSITEAGTAGYEPYSEVMASLIAQVLNLPHVEYTLMPAKLFPDIKNYSCDVVSVCPLFVKPGDQLYHFADMADAHFLATGEKASPEALFQYAVELYGKSGFIRCWPSMPLSGMRIVTKIISTSLSDTINMFFLRFMITAAVCLRGQRTKN